MQLDRRAFPYGAWPTSVLVRPMSSWIQQILRTLRQPKRVLLLLTCVALYAVIHHRYRPVAIVENQTGREVHWVCVSGQRVASGDIDHGESAAYRRPLFSRPPLGGFFDPPDLNPKEAWTLSFVFKDTCEDVVLFRERAQWATPLKFWTDRRFHITVHPDNGLTIRRRLW